MSPARYREFAPCAALQPYIRAFFTYTTAAANDPARGITREIRFAAGTPSWSNLFADGHVSVVFAFGTGYRVDGLWEPGPARPHGHVIGAMSTVRATSPGESLVQVGAYFRAAEARRFTGVPACELTNRIIALEDLWGARASQADAEFGEARGDEERVRRLESALLARMMPARRSALDVPGLAAWALRRQRRLSVEDLAHAAGVSRQHLTRAFRESVGVTPKLYCRLARFQAGLSYSRRAAHVDWAQAAAELGYADQSHMIAEFRQFSGLTPGSCASGRTFHPFMPE